MNYLLTLAYDGTEYCGFQVQPNGRSVAAAFQDGLEAVLGARPDIKGCSRTDAGVHALGFALSFEAALRIPLVGIVTEEDKIFRENVLSRSRAFRALAEACVNLPQIEKRRRK